VKSNGGAMAERDNHEFNFFYGDKKNVFRVPADYFENLESRFLDRRQPEVAKINVKFSFYSFRAAAILTLFAVLSSVIYIFYRNSEKSFAYDQDAVAAYHDLYNIDENLISQVFHEALTEESLLDFSHTEDYYLKEYFVQSQIDLTYLILTNEEI